MMAGITHSAADTERNQDDTTKPVETPDRGAKHPVYHQPGVLRVLQTKEETQAFYNKIARVYDLLAEHSEAPVRRMGLEMLDVQRGQNVVEIGFGTGHCLVALADSVGPTGKVFGMDLSKKMLEVSHARLRDQGLKDRVELTCGDALHLPYPSQSMDRIFMSFTLELFDTPEIPMVLSECRRVMRTGGRIVVVSMSRVSPGGIVMQAFEWTHRHFPDYLDCRPILVRQAIEDAGFRVAAARTAKMWVNVEIVCGVKGADSAGWSVGREMVREPHA